MASSNPAYVYNEETHDEDTKNIPSDNSTERNSLSTKSENNDYTLGSFHIKNNVPSKKEKSQETNLNSLTGRVLGNNLKLSVNNIEKDLTDYSINQSVINGSINSNSYSDEKAKKRDSEDPLYPPGEERRMIRNVVMVGVVFMMHFTATLGVTHLQSSVNAAEGLGTSALAAQYAGLVFSSLVVTVYLINKLGCKWSIVVAIIAHMPYMAGQLYPRVYTLVPTALIMGMGTALLWSAKCTYLCVISEANSQLTGAALKTVRDKAIGVFFMIFLLSMVWGNLVSSLVLSSGDDINHNNMSLEGICGVDFCPGSNEASKNPNLERPSQQKITIMISVFLACMALGCFIAAVGVDSLKRYKEGERTSTATGLSTFRLLTATLELHRHKEMLLMIPISVWLGVDYAFVEAEYTASFVACAWGIRNIGYVIICYGLANSGLALITGWLVARAGRRPVLCIAASLHVIIMASLYAWQPNPDQSVLFFVVAALLGAADGHWCVQLNSLYAILFPGKEEAAYSNFRLWQSVGFIIAFSYSHYLCTSAKLYVVIGLLVFGVAGYLAIEFSRSRKTDPL
ncbi:UNC93-like protein [Anabrus simplex]|uniref:UNC93-like protein n=1 Tax=Anabrus simplex TaxID=316456 RepID=UPI0035A31D50